MIQTNDLDLVHIILAIKIQKIQKWPLTGSLVVDLALTSEALELPLKSLDVPGPP